MNRFILILFVFLLTSCQVNELKVKYCFSPTISSDNSKVAFLYKYLNSEYKVSYSIYIAKTDGLNSEIEKYNLDNVPYKKLKFIPYSSSCILEKDNQIYKFDLDRSKPIYLTDGKSIDFSNDGKNIVYINPDNTKINLMELNTLNTASLGIKLNGSIYYPTWTNDGEKIQFLLLKNDTNKGIINKELYICNYNLLNNSYSEIKLISPFNYSVEVHGQWNKLKNKFVFSYNNEIYVMSIDNYKIEKICNGTDPSWFADNSRIVYTLPINDIISDIYIYDFKTNESILLIDSNKLE